MTTYYLEDFTAGQMFKSSGRTITETDLTLFSMVSGDWNPIHADIEFAKGTRYGERVVHGVLGIAIAIGKLHELGIFEHSAIAMLGLQDWNFLAPVLVGDTLHLELTITSVETGKSGRNGTLGRRFRLFNQKGQVVQEGQSKLLLLSRQGLPVTPA